MKKRISIYFFVIVVIAYIIWSNTGRDYQEDYSFKKVEQFVHFEHDSSRSHVVGIQPYMTNLDYQSEERFFKKLDFYLNTAQNRNWITKETMVVFPEHLSTWLVASGEKNSVFKAETIDEAMRIVALSNLVTFLYKLINSKSKDSAKDAIFQMKANEMAGIYQNVFSKLAKKYNVTIVAGSIFLPTPFVENGKIKTKTGEIYNVSAVFGIDGKIKVPLTLKNHPTKDELTFCVPSKEPNNTYLLNNTKVGILICADSWFQKNYDDLDKKQTRVVVIPAYSAGENLWESKWKGYSGYDNPVDIDKDDIDRITEGEAWMRYTLARSKNTSIQTAIAVFLRGKIWNLGTDGSSFIFRNDSIQLVPKTGNPIIFKVDI